MAAPRQIVDGPGFTPLPYGLWDAIQHPSTTGPHWQNGVVWSEWCGGGDTLYEECLAVTGTGGAPTSQAAMASNITQTNRSATAFTVYTEFDCSAVGLSDAERAATDALAKVEPWQVEKAFWTGTAGKTAVGGVAQTTVFPHLASTAQIADPNAPGDNIVLQPAASVVATGAGDDAAITMGQLERTLSDCYHGQGVIHVAFEALATLRAFRLVEDDDTGSGALYSPAGHRIVVGSGYPGSGPDGTAAPAGTSWIYATGAMFGYRGPVVVPGNYTQSFDRQKNTVRMIAQRTYLLGWECCLVAARMNLGVAQ